MFTVARNIDIRNVLNVRANSVDLLRVFSLIWRGICWFFTSVPNWMPLGFPSQSVIYNQKRLRVRVPATKFPWGKDPRHKHLYIWLELTDMLRAGLVTLLVLLNILNR